MNRNRFSLVGRSALVTGAAGYLGRSMARALAEEGAHVYVNGRNSSSCNELVEQLRRDELLATPAVFDITDPDRIEAFIHSLGSAPLHILVNNAYAGSGGTLKSSDAQQYRDAYEIALVSAQQTLATALPNLRAAVEESGDASVINVASMYAKVSPDLRIYDTPQGSNPPFYGAAKAALLQFTRYAACELGSEGIRVNAIAPGPFPAPDVTRSSPEFVDRLAKKVPLGRIGAAAEIGGPTVFLASSASSFVNGATIAVDGGFTSW